MEWLRLDCRPAGFRKFPLEATERLVVLNVSMKICLLHAEEDNKAGSLACYSFFYFLTPEVERASICYDF